MIRVAFTKHAEDTLKALKGSPDVNHVLSLLERLAAEPPSVPIRSATEVLGSPIPEADIREAVSGEWRIIFVFVEFSGSPIVLVLSIQKSVADEPAKFNDVFTSLVTEVSSSSTAIDPNLFGTFVTEPVFAPEDEKNKREHHRQIG